MKTVGGIRDLIQFWAANATSTGMYEWSRKRSQQSVRGGWKGGMKDDVGSDEYGTSDPGALLLVVVDACDMSECENRQLSC